MSDTSPRVKNFLWFLTGCLVTVLTLTVVHSPEIARAAPPQVETKSFNLQNFNLIDSKEKQFIDYEKDFIDLSKSSGTASFEWELSTELHDIAERVQYHLNAASTLVWIHDNVSCVSDKAKIRPLISFQFSNYGALIDSEVSMVNNELAHTNAPGVATTANQMKEDMRSARTMLASIAQNSFN